MKERILAGLSALFLLAATHIAAQAPQCINYQSILRNGAGAPSADAQFCIRFTINDSINPGTAVYQENQVVITNQFGLFTCQIGKGLPTLGTFSGINWSMPDKYLVLDMDSTCSGNYVYMGSSQLISVPYALYADSAAHTPGFTHKIGQLYGGGIIAALWDSAGTEHGLIASLNDLGSSIQYSSVQSTLIGAAAESYTDGRANTAAILAQGATSGAAYLCAQYAAGGYTDWYLPSYSELNLCYNMEFIINNVLGSVNGLKTGDAYWSSTEQDATSAWAENFGAGGSGANNKNYNGTVRAVRRF